MSLSIIISLRPSCVALTDEEHPVPAVSTRSLVKGGHRGIKPLKCLEQALRGANEDAKRDEPNHAAEWTNENRRERERRGEKQGAKKHRVLSLRTRARITLLVLFSLGPPSPAAAPLASLRVLYSFFSFSPGCVRAPAASKIPWRRICQDRPQAILTRCLSF